MFCLGCSKIPSLRLLAANVSSSLPSLLAQPEEPHRHHDNQSSTLDPKSLMEDRESELFNYTTGRCL
jgi:hypothetical protein